LCKWYIGKLLTTKIQKGNLLLGLADDLLHLHPGHPVRVFLGDVGGQQGKLRDNMFEACRPKCVEFSSTRIAPLSGRDTPLS
jgi:hypothetical protein